LSSIWWVLGRPLSTTDAKSLAGSWRTRFFIGLGLAEVVAPIAFAAALVVGTRWLYVIGLGFALYGLWMIAPSRKNLATAQDRLRLQGSSLDLTSALLG
jgi:high-affinity Fe2+/Pb2+ permease